MTKFAVKQKTVFLSFALMSLILLTGCDKETESSDKIVELIKGSKPLKAAEKDGSIKTITLYEAMKTHEEHEHASNPSEHHHKHNKLKHFCLGITTGFKAIQFANANFSPDSYPANGKLYIKVNGAMDGVWDMFSIYAGDKREFSGKDKPMNLSSFTFNAKYEDSEEQLEFRLKEGIIPDKFFELKNQGFGCGNKELGKAKNKALIKILSSPAQECFELVSKSKSQ
ncbi:hypothetical protein L21SP3_00671 [Sedimentisphaera cyanobacteriorum]|uniref:Lipoprotein n=1 Tax=Sedimentisphaera cyanobacteriorum TaxID=1940790 RepID=A0A1Q2HN54_9BACT|nr:hypothetical protein [Sedimentisphaera cyanobacteriorum]AQQ08878.1 hypothetical protein L21SP3_00671 [Sedimentisphaera cyanobacteriorum]